MKILIRLVKSSSKKLIFFGILFIIFGIFNYLFYPIIAKSLQMNNTQLSLILLPFYILTTNILESLKERIQMLSNIERINWINTSYRACIDINYELFESNYGKEKFNKAINATNSSNAAFSKIYLDIFQLIYLIIYSFIVISLMILSHHKTVHLFFIFIFIPVISFLEIEKLKNYSESIIHIFTKSNRNFRYLKKITKYYDYCVLLKNFKATNFIANEYRDLNNEIKRLLDEKLNKLRVSILIFNTVKLIFVMVLIYKANIFSDLVTIIIILQYIRIWDIISNTVFEFRNDYRRIVDFFDFIDISQDDKNKSVNINSIDSIEFKNVNFHYGRDNKSKTKFAIKNLNLKINKGEKIAIVGENGSGKSTLVKLMINLYNPKEGRILINGHDINDIKNLKDKLSIIFQDDVIIPTDIKNNITMGLDFNKANMDKSLKESGFDFVLKKNDLSLEDYLGSFFLDNAKDLSGGEEQLLFLARAIYKNNDLYIWDEPSGNLDPIKEKKLSDRIKEITEDSTVIYITHRVSAIESFDRIITLKDGKIEEEGSFEELIKNEGLTYELFKKRENIYN